ncbi:MAG: hypothetical protein KDA38_15305, partial [Planctomycetales bacterium]|nr:hypothetical protein [Planctomycetales bacterium]
GSIATNIAREVLTLADRMLGNILDLEKSIRNAPLTAVCLVFESLLNQVSNAQTGAGEGEGEGPTPLTDEELDAALQSIIDASDDFIAGNQTVMEAIDSNTGDANGELDTLDEDLVSPLVVGDGAVKLGYWRVLVGTTEIRGRTNESGIINPLPFLPPETPYRFEIYDFAHQVVSTSIGVSAVSGTDTELAPFRSETLIGEPDLDMDGLADLAERIVGTAIDRVDTDGDGIADFAELEQGLNPLGNRPFATGMVGSLPLNGEAREIVIEGGLANDQSQTAYLATGSFGLAIVDVSRFQQPLLISEIDLPGSNVDVSVDSRLGIAVVASDVGLHVVDVSMPSEPQLLQTLRGNFTHVEVMDGLAFAAVGGGLRVYDLLTGERVLAGSVSGDSIVGMAREGSRFYFRSSTGDLTIVDFESGSLVTRGTLNVESTPGKIFVASGVAYLAAEDGFNGGFSTVDVSDPDDPQLLSGVDNTSFAGQTVVVNGSGLAIAVGNPGGVFGANALDLVDIGDLADTSQFQTRYGLPAAPSSVVLAAGIAFVADGEAGLQVVNYRSFDSAGVPPTVSIDLSAEDADADEPGIQIQEGTLLAIRPIVNDDVQVRGVQLLINDEVVASDVSFPFELATLLPTIEQAGGVEAGEVVLSVRAADTGGNVGVSEDITIQLVPDTFAPSVTSTNIPDGSRQGVMFRAVKFAFSEAIAQSTINAESFVLTGPDGVVDPLDVQ